ncbi:MAG: valine--pyruvate transaminase [Verrucomicrobiota bacterium]
MNSETEISFSALGRRIAQGSGIEDLMEDLGVALARQDTEMAMLGGGNPAPIPEGIRLWREQMKELLESDDGAFDRMLGFYDPHQGNRKFIQTIVDLFNREYGWNLTPENVSVTNGGQTAFFFLFTLLGDSEGKILFPVSPEYIGYSSLGLDRKSLLSIPGKIEILEEPFFRYRIDFSKLPNPGSIRAACVSRPTNPTGNVLSLQELEELYRYCRESNALLIVDNAYGTPFPNMIFRDEQPFWKEGVVLTYSLSKLGLPGTRTGIVIGPPAICKAVSSMTALVGLANGSIGQAMTRPLFADGRLLDFCRNIVRPYYEERAEKAVGAIQTELKGIRYLIHKPDGALFLWLWFPDLGIASDELYERLKTAGVLVVPGQFFFHNLAEDWDHSQECIRVNYAMDIDSFPEAVRRMAGVLREINPE